MPRHDWHKSSFSGDQANCIEIAASDGTAALRIRESDAPGVILTAEPAALAALAGAVRGGRFGPRRPQG